MQEGCYNQVVDYKMPASIGITILSGILGVVLGLIIARWYLKRKVRKFGEKALEVFGDKIVKLGVEEATRLGYNIKEEEKQQVEKELQQVEEEVKEQLMPEEKIDDTLESEELDPSDKLGVTSNSEPSSVPPAS